MSSKPRGLKERSPLAQILTDARVKKGMTQMMLGEVTGYSNTCIRNWELGWHKPRKRALVDWCQALGVDPQTVVGLCKIGQNGA